MQNSIFKNLIPLAAGGALVLASGNLHALKLVSAANAPNPEEGVDSMTYAKETLLTTESIMEGGVTYYNLMSDHWLSAPADIGLVAAHTAGRYYVTYELSGMVFSEDVNDADINRHVYDANGGTYNISGDDIFEKIAGGNAKDKTVAFVVEMETTTIAPKDALVLEAKFAISGAGAGSIKRTVLNDNLSNIPGLSSTKAHSLANGIVAKPALKETIHAVDSPIASAAHAFMQFSPASSTAPNLVDTVGGLTIGLEDYRNAQAAADAATLMVAMLSDITATPDMAEENSVTFGGNLSFVDKFALGDADCSQLGTDLRTPSEDDPTMLTHVIMAQSAADFGPDVAADTNEGVTGVVRDRHLCIMVDGETRIPATSPYTVTTMYAGLTDAAYPPAGATHMLTGIVRDGTTAHIPYLTTYDGYNHRITLSNRGGLAAAYEITFRPEDGVMAQALHGASGTLDAGETKMMLASEVVELTGGSRTAATVTVVAPKASIDVSTTLVNNSTGTAVVTWAEKE